MAKTRKVTVRLDEATYQAITHAAKERGVTISNYIRLLTLRSAEVVNAGMMDYVVDVMAKDLAQELYKAPLALSGRFGYSPWPCAWEETSRMKLTMSEEGGR